MKHYKDFDKICIGGSDAARLIADSPSNIGRIRFVEDGAYSAYECFGDVAIGSHYTKVFSCTHWLAIYDDGGLAYKKHEMDTGYHHVDIYRSGDYGCIIHWHN